MKKNLIILSLLLISFSTSAKIIWSGESLGQKLALHELVKDQDIIWGMTFLNDEQLLFTEKSGNFKLFELKNKKITTLSGAPKVFSDNQGGLLDVAWEPNGEWIYFTYVKPQGETGVTTLARAKLAGTKLVEMSDLIVTKTLTGETKHFGSRIVFLGDEVFVSLGDRGHRPNGQDRSNHAGSILRLKKDGTIPTDNPFVTDKTSLPEIWSYGHRNIQGMVYDPTHQRLWAIEHGPRGGDELNLIEKGANYGWARVSLGREYWNPFRVGEATTLEGMKDPLLSYTPSIAPSGLEIYSGKVLKEWKGHLLAGALALTHLNRIEIEETAQGPKAKEAERLFQELDLRIRDVIEGPDGLIYLSTDDGKILQLALAK